MIKQIIKHLKPYRYRLVAYVLIAVLLATLAIVAPPVKVEITSEGMLSVDMGVGIGIQEAHASPDNDFSGDANCVALWKYDNAATDSKGGNDLTPVNTPTYDSGDKKEGTHSTDLEHDSTQYFTITDGDLDAGFPGKSGTGEQSFSICCWVKPESIPSGVWHAPVCKSNVASDIMSYAIVLQNDGKINLFIGYNGGADFDYLPFDTALSTGIWYHVAVTYDSSDNGMKIRIWDDNAGSLLDSNKTDTAAGDMSPDSAPLEIGRWDGSDARTFDGKIDEVVIFKDVLTDDEIDEIRAGTYGGCNENISNSPSTWSVNGGSSVAANSNYSTGLDYFTITNNSGGVVDITISGTDMLGGNWDWSEQGAFISKSVSGWDSTYVRQLGGLIVSERFHFWYGGYAGSNWQLGYAYSDNMTSSTKGGYNPVIAYNAYDSSDTDVRDPSVALKDSTYYVYVQTRDPSGWRVCLSTTTDPAGNSYSHYGTVIPTGGTGEFDEVWAASPALLQDDFSTITMFYEALAADGTYTIGKAHSSNGTSFTKDGVIQDLDGNTLYAPAGALYYIVPVTAVKINEAYYLFVHYATGSGVEAGVLYSGDLTHWAWLEQDVTAYGYGSPFIIEKSDTWYLYSEIDTLGHNDYLALWTNSGTEPTCWFLSDSATPGTDVYGLKAGLYGGDYTVVVKRTTTYNTLVSSLADSATQDWGLKLWTPTSYSEGVAKSGTVTITATCS
jgi:hypothetical protein